MAAAAIASGVGAIAPSLINLFHSAAQYRRGRDLLDSSEYPAYAIPEPVEQNRAMAMRLAMTGLPQEQYQNALNNISRGQNFGLNALQTRGGSIGSVNALVGEGNDATLRLDAMDASQRIRNMGTLFDANNELARYQDNAFRINKLQRYLMKLGMATGQMQAGNVGLNSSLNSLAASAPSIAQAFQGLGKKTFVDPVTPIPALGGQIQPSFPGMNINVPTTVMGSY